MSVELKESWERWRFRVSGAQLSKTVELQEKSEEYGWIQSKPSIFAFHYDDLDDDEENLERANRLFEKDRELRYSRPLRYMAGNAVSDLPWDWCIHLGVPEEKHCDDETLDKYQKIVSWTVVLRESSSTSEGISTPNGFMGYTAPYEKTPESTWIDITLPSDVFDDLEKLYEGGAGDFTIEINIKCWRASTAVGGPQLYIEKEGRASKLELSSISAESALSSQSTDNNDSSVEAVSDIELALLESLQSINSKLESIRNTAKMAVTLAALAAIVALIF